VKLLLPLMPGGAERCIGDIFAKVEFRYLLAAAIDRCELEQNGKREVVVEAGLTAKL